MKTKIIPIVHQPTAVKDRERKIRRCDAVVLYLVSFPLILVVVGLVAGTITSRVEAKRVSPTVSVWTGNVFDESVVWPYGVSIDECPAPSPVPLPSFLSRAQDETTRRGANLTERTEMYNRWVIESRHCPTAISPSLAYGICGAHKESHKWIDENEIMVNPEYAGCVCLLLYRDAKVCGKDWQCCYLRGEQGCRDWLAKTGKKLKVTKVKKVERNGRTCR